MRESSCSPPAHVRRRDCSSTPSPRNSPNGLANTSGVVGKYLTDTTGTDVAGFIPKMVDHVPHNEDGVGGLHIYMPWWVDNKKLDFPRGYHIEVRRRVHGSAELRIHGRHPALSVGRRLRQVAQGRLPPLLRLVGLYAGRGEMIPNDKSYCEIDPVVKDKYGIPVLRFHWQWS